MTNTYESGYETIIRDYLRTKGSARPSDLEDDLAGGFDVFAMLSGRPGNWHRSPFCAALGRMVERGEVSAEKDRDGWLYKLVPSS